MKKFLIVGQGIAGTLLAWALRKSGAMVHLADGDLGGSSTPSAAGIINPVTGKRFVKSWRFDEFYPIAQNVYQQLEQELGIPIWEDRPTLRLLSTPEEANDWSIRCAQADYADHLGETSDAGDWGAFLKPGFKFGVIRKSARANLPLLISSYRESALSQGFFLHKTIDYQEVDQLLKTYDQVIFCEGYRATTNPFFPEIQFRVSKGEALIIRFPNSNARSNHSNTKAPEANDADRSSLAGMPTDMLKKTVLLTPLGNDTFWAGSTYDWQFKDYHPSQEGREFISGHLQEMFAAPLEIIGHVAGIRPTMLDRRPLVEQSKLNSKVFLFNGLGTKGALLGPYFATQLAASLH